MPKAASFFQEILLKTNQGRIKWEPTAHEGTFVTSIGGEFTVRIARQRRPDVLQPNYHMIVKDKDNREILRIQEGVDNLEGSQFEELFLKASSQALDVDDKLDRFLTELQRL
ncbi:MAG: hypothetical protein FJW37_14515 [Acidobacteria bacterium]|nr:hypothetical protein [Acidobacteriota bacterium]